MLNKESCDQLYKEWDSLTKKSKEPYQMQELTPGRNPPGTKVTKVNQQNTTKIKILKEKLLAECCECLRPAELALLKK